MQFSTLISLSGLVALVAAQNPFSFSTLSSITAGTPFNITWSPSTGTTDTVTLVLRQGDPNSLATIATIAPGIKNTGSYLWTPPTSLVQGAGYAFEIVDDGNTAIVNYSSRFSIVSTNTVPSVLPSSTSPPSSSGSSPSSSGSHSISSGSSSGSLASSTGLKTLTGTSASTSSSGSSSATGLTTLSGTSTSTSSGSDTTSTDSSSSESRATTGSSSSGASSATGSKTTSTGSTSTSSVPVSPTTNSASGLRIGGMMAVGVVAVLVVL